jgi:YidC/Oxa1 family membrane protein insertase
VEFLNLLWNEGIVRPMTNSLVFLYILLFHNFGLSIAIFTLLTRVVTYPLTLRQLRQAKAMAELQPKIQELQKRYAKDRQRISQETMRLYREHHVNPVGCLGPMIIQMPILFGLWIALSRALPSTPESLVDLAQRLYPWPPALHAVIPLNSRFLWMDLAFPDRYPLLPILVGVSTWVSQKMSSLQTGDPRQQQTNQMLLWMMPAMFAFWTILFPSGLALYWVISNLAQIVTQYFVTGWGGLLPRRLPAGPPPAGAPGQPAKETSEHGEQKERGSERKERGGGRGAGDQAARREARRGGDRGSQPR